jgi:hypothetical protein
MSPTVQPFICPECSSRESSIILNVETAHGDADPWTGVLQRIICAQCGSVIPAHVGERWNGMSIAAAQREWKKTYRRDNQRQIGDDDTADVNPGA